MKRQTALSVSRVALTAFALAAAAGLAGCEDGNRKPAFGAMKYAGVGTSAIAQHVADTSTQVAGISEIDAAFIVEAALESTFEISLAQLALRKGAHPTVQAYAEMTIRDNAQVAIALQALTGGKGVQLLLQPDPEHVARLIQLRQQHDGHAFDVAHAGVIERSHMQTVRLYERALKQTRDADVRDFADSALQLLRSRRDEVELVGADGTT